MLLEPSRGGISENCSSVMSFEAPRGSKPARPSFAGTRYAFAFEPLR